MYYGMLCAAATMFGLQFFCSNAYRSRVGEGFRKTLALIVGSSLTGLVLMLLIGWLRGVEFGITLFTVLMAFLASLNSMACSVFGQLALGKINLSLYSLFMMLGGMMLPFLAGVLFFGEPLTVGGILCMVFLTAALAVSAQKGKSGGTIYYLGIFFFNGLAGILSKLFHFLPGVWHVTAGSAESYTAIASAFSALMALILFFIVKGEKPKFTPAVTLAVVGGGTLNRVANLLLLISLAHLPASVQYPFVTGGVIVVSTVLAFLTPKKPRLAEWIGVVLAFAGIAALLIF